MNSKFLMTLLAWLLLLLLTCWIWCNWCNNSCGGECCKSDKQGSLTYGPFKFTDGGFDLRSMDNIAFLKNSDVPIIPSSVERKLDSLSAYFKNHPEKRLMINAYSASDENPDLLGASRADALKKYFASKGIAESNIDIKGAKLDNITMNGADTLFGPCSFVATMGEKPTNIESPKTIFSPRVVYFESGKNTLAINDELKAYFGSVNKYLAENPAAKLSVTGYTDDVGDSEPNLVLSQRRAGYMIKNLEAYEIPKGRMFASGKGEADPIAENTSPEGRSKNRRVEIQLADQ